MCRDQHFTDSLTELGDLTIQFSSDLVAEVFYIFIFYLFPFEELILTLRWYCCLIFVRKIVNLVIEICSVYFSRLVAALAVCCTTQPLQVDTNAIYEVICELHRCFLFIHTSSDI